MPLTKTQREQKRLEEAELVRRHRAALADDTLRQRSEPPPELPPGPCRLHPEWRPRHWELGGGGTCPECVAAELVRREHGGSRELSKVGPQAGTDQQQAALMAHREKHPPAPDEIEPGTRAEADALAFIDGERAEEVEAERLRSQPARIGGHLVSARSEQNIWTEFWKVPGRGIVRVTP